MKKTRSSNTLSFLDSDGSQNTSNPKIDIVKLAYLSAESMTWREVFEGFQELRAITFSSGINFVYALLDLFDRAEIIFGNEAVLSGSIQEIMAHQSLVLDRLRETEGKSRQKLLDRIDDQSVHLYVARKQLSHEKIYLLKATDGRKRVVMGSANLSYNAFGGVQRENICMIDDDAAYQWYLDRFNDFLENTTDEICKKRFLVADTDENLDALPVSETVRTKKVLVIENAAEVSDEVQFILDTHRLAKKLAPVLPPNDKKAGKVYINSDYITTVRRKRTEEIVRQKELRSEYPEMVLDVFDQTVTLNGEPLDLSPAENEITDDVELFLKYMEGYTKFHGDYAGMQYRYFEFANWFFCSPFMAVMRDTAVRFDQNKLPYPVFGLVYGQSKAGKTSFLETLLKMMIGQKPKISAPDFTRSNIEELKRTVQGAPIIVDDLTQTRFNQHAIETIKNDDFGISEHLTSYPAVVISANEDVKAVAPEVTRRTVICRVEAGLTNTEVMKSNIVRMVQQKMGTAFYREYLSRMLDSVPDLIEKLKAEDTESAPDILALSSEILVSIIKEHHGDPPAYIRTLSLEDYFGEQVTGKHAKKAILNAWKTIPKSFVVKPKANELRYNAGQTYEADRLMKELPETLEVRRSREWIVMNLTQAKEFFGIDFKSIRLPWKK